MSTEQQIKCFEYNQTEGEVGPVKPVEFYITNAVLLMWFSVLLAIVSVSILFPPSSCLDDLAEWSHFGKELLI